MCDERFCSGLGGCFCLLFGAENNGTHAQKAAYASLDTKDLLASPLTVPYAHCDLIAPTIPHPVCPSNILIDFSRRLR